MEQRANSLPAALNFYRPMPVEISRALSMSTLRHLAVAEPTAGRFTSSSMMFLLYKPVQSAGGTTGGMQTSG